MRQRVKIVEVDSVCAEGGIAEQVVGIGCSHPYFCAPKPSSSSIDGAQWDNLAIHSSAHSKEYKVCYNKGLTFDRYQWHEVPGRLAVKESTYIWSTEPKDLSRRTEDFKLTITRPSFDDFG